MHRVSRCVTTRLFLDREHSVLERDRVLKIRKLVGNTRSYIRVSLQDIRLETKHTITVNTRRDIK